ncbi:Serine/threonine-protein kinase C [Acaryochloris thomasi RCC1774]|uniref:non-specific serine/threonine protein kinase n=1 Tax=Acaryochloris thomasi RCC1774 TaxID=1764569 RepID=A0A2W1JND2_9CYAN|nr:serine/threonine-protein kinase [Acaryochloris thomasi]PZD70761.1 Serine/threonine-protein kinase C [Acaryochloris thomasi RCC1774]
MLAGRYKIIKEFKDGGFSQTFLAKDQRHPQQRRCVIKKLQPQDTDAFTVKTARHLFTEEVNALKKLGHYTQIPQLYTTFTDGSDFYLVEEFVVGRSLARELRWGRNWSEARVLELLQNILTTLAFVHRQGVIHRDLKPQNLIRRQSDQSIVLIDFGSIQQCQTSSDAVVGTDGYIPPEQLQGYPNLCSDVYAVGMVALQALTGIDPTKRAFDVDERTGKVNWGRYPKISSDLANVIDTMVCYKLRDRYSSASEALRSINTLFETPRRSAAVPTRRRFLRFVGAFGLLGTGLALPTLLSNSETSDRVSFQLPLPTASSGRSPKADEPKPFPLVPVPTPLEKAELIERYGSYNECCKIAVARGIQFHGAPSWEKLIQAFSYLDAIQEFSHGYMAAYPSLALSEVKFEVNLLV